MKTITLKFCDGFSTNLYASDEVYHKLIAAMKKQAEPISPERGQA